MCGPSATWASSDRARVVVFLALWIALMRRVINLDPVSRWQSRVYLIRRRVRCLLPSVPSMGGPVAGRTRCARNRQPLTVDPTTVVANGRYRMGILNPCLSAVGPNGAGRRRTLPVFVLIEWVRLTVRKHRLKLLARGTVVREYSNKTGSVERAFRARPSPGRIQRRFLMVRRSCRDPASPVVTRRDFGFRAFP